MRTIKFRGKRIDNGEWVYGYYTALPTMSGKTRHQIKTPKDDHSYQYEVHSESLGQFTGLLDKNCMEIYEGDIVKSDQWNPSTFQVGFDRGAFCFFNEGDSYYNDCKYLEQFEVIGNIHETNPA